MLLFFSGEVVFMYIYSRKGCFFPLSVAWHRNSHTVLPPPCLRGPSFSSLSALHVFPYVFRTQVADPEWVPQVRGTCHEGVRAKRTQ